MVNVDLTITLSALIESGGILTGGVVAFIGLRSTVRSLKTELALAKKDTKEQFTGIQNELKKLGEILINMARFDERITNLDKRVTAQGRSIEDLRRGVGFVRSTRESIDGEYP